MYEDDLYMNSLCSEGIWLHDFHIIKEFPDGVIELCNKCRLRKYFKHNHSNKNYLSYHVKQSLQPYQKRFNKEYPNFKRK